MFDFASIRGESAAGKRDAFELLVCRLARLEPVTGEFRSLYSAGGDGGVEAYWLLPTGKKIGYQAKYFPKDVDWTQIYDSVHTALTQHPDLEQYIIALPRDFTGKRAARGGTSTEGMWGTWDEWKAEWNTLAASKGLTVEFIPWTAFEVERRLETPAAAHLIPFFFTDTRVLADEWMDRWLRRTTDDLHARYSPDEHVDTASLHAFDVIYRRTNVVSDLDAVFAHAHAADVRAAAALAPVGTIAEDAIVSVEKAICEFLPLRSAVHAPLPQSWPVCQWLKTWYMTTRQMMDMMRPIETGKCDRALRERVAEMLHVYSLLGLEVFAGPWAHLLPIDGARAALFLGRAGGGKSHALARAASVARASGAPVIHLLGQHFRDHDPRVSLLKHLELSHWQFEDFLSALDLAAEMAKTRALLVIDALNEGDGLQVWPHHLRSFIRDINAHERIDLVVSCREEYLPFIIAESDDLLARPHLYPDDQGRVHDCEPLGKLVAVRVDGFRGTLEREQAMQRYMDAKGIARPTAPVLDDQFFNPLFISSVCRSMAKAGVTVFPRGLHGSSEMFTFVLDTKAKALGTPYDRSPQVLAALVAALGSLARSMVARRTDSVPMADAVRLVDDAFAAMPLTNRSWVGVLEGSDILRRDIEGGAARALPLTAPNEVIRFSFQRLQDHLIARELASQCGDIEDAFRQGGELAFLVERTVNKEKEPLLRPAKPWVGVLGALWSIVAETQGKELYDAGSFFAENKHYYLEDFCPLFRASIRERRGEAFTPRTWQLLHILWENEPDERLAIVLSMSCVPDHAWNARFLADNVLPMPIDKWKAAWARYFGGDRSAARGRAMEIAEWATQVNPATSDAEVISLAALTLACVCEAPHEKLREQVAAGLANLFKAGPQVKAGLLARIPAENAEIRKTLDAADAMNAETATGG